MLRPLIHLAAFASLGAFGLALGRWLRDPDAGGPLLGLVLLAGIIALALRWLYRPRGPTATQGTVPPVASDDRVELNSATLEELQRLPGVGPVAARRIVEDREAKGPFASVEELARVPGFGPAKVRVLADRAWVAPPTAP